VSRLDPKNKKSLASLKTRPTNDTHHFGSEFNLPGTPVKDMNFYLGMKNSGKDS
jgi:hypothetical protein